MTIETTAGVAAALVEGRPVVALETSVLAQGLPSPRNAEAATRMAEAVRAAGAEPAWTWISDGAVRVGAGDADLERLIEGSATKVARRDIPVAVAAGVLGATTVSATLWAAARAGIPVTATGGIGGVHLGGEDVSADLVALASEGGLLVCSGPKSIIEPAETMERLEELGVPVVAFGSTHLPHFVVRHAPIEVEHRADDPGTVARMLEAAIELDTRSTLLVCNPCPEDVALDEAEVSAAVEACRVRAAREGVAGKSLTPYLLGCLAERTGGRSLEANLALLESNAALAGSIAVEVHRTAI